MYVTLCGGSCLTVGVGAGVDGSFAVDTGTETIWVLDIELETRIAPPINTQRFSTPIETRMPSCNFVIPNNLLLSGVFAILSIPGLLLNGATWHLT